MALPQFAHLLKTIEMGRARYQFGLERVPAERLNWSPGGAAGTPLQLAAKTAGFMQFFAAMLETGEMPDRTAARPPELATREAAADALEAAFRRAYAAVDGLTESLIRKTVPVPWGKEMPIEAMAFALAGIIGYLQGQMNYLQLAYGDTDPNIPPNWGQYA